MNKVENLTEHNILYCNGIKVANGIVTLANGTILPPVPGKCSNIVIKNNNVYINGYEFKRGKWRKTLRAFFANIR